MKVAHLSEPAEERVVFRDGLGVRERRDTGTGEVVEWLHLDPAFASVEIPLRERVTRLSTLQHVKFARILSLEPSRKDRGPVLVSSHVVGTRLAEVLEMAGHGLVTFDPGAGLQVTRDVLGALAVLHDSRNVAHGALGPERVVLTATGRVVMVEHVLAQALDRLQRPRHQLWREWRIATPPAAGQVRFDMQTDLAQAGVVALALLLGRPIEEEEYPHRLRGLLPLVQDRLAKSPAAAIGGDVVAWLERLAPVDSRRAFKTVHEAQQAFEGLVSGGAAALGVTHARVKGVLTAIAAIAGAPLSPASVEAPSSRGQQPAPSIRTTVAESAQDRGSASATINAAEADAEIDIEALLALEVELEGGTFVLAPAAPFERYASLAPPVDPPVAVPVAPALDAIAQERLDLERQFAALVDTVAPADDAPIHLIPETPLTSEPLVDARVLWSSMPADVTDVADVTEAVSVAEVVADELEMFVSVEPIVVMPPDEPLLAATVEHMPSNWWKEALPWRVEEQPTAEVAAVGETFGYLSLEDIEARATNVDPVGEPEVDTAAEAHAEFSPVWPVKAPVEAPIEAIVEPERVDTLTDPVSFSLSAQEQAVLEADVADDPLPPVLAPVDIEGEAGDVLVLLEEEAEVAADEPALEAVATDEPFELLDVVDETPAAASAEAPSELNLAVGQEASGANAVDDVPTVDALQDLATVIDEAWDGPLDMSGALVVDATPDPAFEAATAADEAPAAAAAQDEPALVAVAPAVIVEDELPIVEDASPSADAKFGNDEAMAPVSGYRLFGDIVPIILQDDVDLSSPDTPFGRHAAAAAPRVAASSLLGRAGGTDNATDWRRTFLDVTPAEADASEGHGGFFSDRPTVADAGVAAIASAEESYDVECAPAPVAAETVAATDDEFVEPLLTSAMDATEPGAAVASDVASEVISVDVTGTVVADVEWPEVPALAFAEVVEATLDVVPAPLLESVQEPVQEPEPVPVAEPEAEPARDGIVDPAGEPAVETATDDAEPVAPQTAVPPGVPEVVIVDDDLGRDAWDDLPSEGTARAELGPASGRAIVVETSAETIAPKKKRRRTRRRNGEHADEVAVPTVVAPIVAMPIVTAPIVAAPIAPVAAPGPVASVASAASGREEDTPRSRSLLDREVPAWTPPSDLGLMPSHAAQPPPGEVVASLETPGEINDDSATPLRTLASAPVLPARPGPISNPMTVLSDVVPAAHPVVVSPEALRPFEHEIRAVGMPDLDAREPRSGRTAITSMADALGPSSGATPAGTAGPTHLARPTVADTRGLAPSATPAASRGMNWRRVIAASVLIALFQGVAFAAWWWVQPGARGTLVVQTAKQGVEVLLDDKVVGRTPFREEVVPGRHKLGLRQGTNVREMPVEISVGVVTTQAIDWPSSVGGKGTLQITSNPTGAEVFINGKSRGTAPLLLEDLPAGDQSLTLRSDAGSVTVNATVLPDETTPLEVKIFAGWIQVDAPVEVNLLLGGREKIGSSMDGQILLPPGTHRVQAVNDALGIRQWLTVTVEPGAVRRVPFNVQPATLTLQEEAEVFVDGTSAGTTPGTIRIAPGTHDLLIRHADGAERRQAMTVRSGQRIEF